MEMMCGSQGHEHTKEGFMAGAEQSNGQVLTSVTMYFSLIVEELLWWWK